MVCKHRDGNALTQDSTLVGRDLELGRLDAFLDGVASGTRSALLIEGEPGTGKTALWEEGLSFARERGYRTLVARPAEVETALSFTALLDLLEPVLDDVLPGLPEPQRRALEIALLLRPADGASDRRALATAVLNGLRALVDASPVIVAVDDAQWLDSASQVVLAFAARRLDGECVGFLLTRRHEGEAVPLELEAALTGRIERLSPAPLSVGALNRLLQMNFGHTFSRPLVRRLREVSAGNPFFTLELARAFEQSGRSPDAVRELPLPATLREVVHTRLALLPAAERRLLVAVAALSHPTLTLLSAATGRAIEASSLRRALEARVVEVDGDRLRFTHPLLGSVVYADAGAVSRRRLHAQLARVVSDPEESVRHLALAAAGPDPRVASRLDEAAGIVHARGAPDRAAELLTRAVELTPAGDPRARSRSLAAADCWTDAGDSGRAVPLLEAAIATARPGDERAEALARLGWIRCRNAGIREGSRSFEEAAREQSTEPAVRISIEKGLSWADEMLGDLAAAEEHARAAVALAEAIGDPAIEEQSLVDLGFIELLRGRPEFHVTMSRAPALEPSGDDRVGMGRPRWPAVRTRWFGAVVLSWTDQLDAARQELLDLRAQAFELGHEQVLPNILNWLGRVDCFAGNWEAALSSATDGYEASVQAGLTVERPYSLATIAIAQAHLGNAEPAWAAIGEGLDVAERLELLPGRLELLAAKGFLELSLGQPQDAHATLAGLHDQAHAAGFAQPAALRFHPDLVEAALATGDQERARRCRTELETCAATLGSPWACALSARCAGMVAAAEGDMEAALERLEDALVQHARLPSPFERGRTLVQHGVVLRRLRRKRGARQSIESALGIFEELDARLWAERARAELARISGSSPTDTTRLTETEARVAALVAAGRANKQVAAELYVTVRTVESNLTSIYRKLGISSRSQLAATLNDPR